MRFEWRGLQLLLPSYSCCLCAKRPSHKIENARNIFVTARLPAALSAFTVAAVATVTLSLSTFHKPRKPASSPLSQPPQASCRTLISCKNARISTVTAVLSAFSPQSQQSLSTPNCRNAAISAFKASVTAFAVAAVSQFYRNAAFYLSLCVSF
jgi:hypothetical protein